MSVFHVPIAPVIIEPAEIDTNHTEIFDGAEIRHLCWQLIFAPRNERIVTAGATARRSLMRRPAGTPVIVAYATFFLVGVSAGVTGVLLVAQMSYYGVDRAIIGITFFTGTAGFVLAGATAGALINRYGFRIALAIGSGAFVLAGLYTATRPPFVAFVILQVLFGYATGVVESVLNAYLTTLPGATALLNRLHAFFGLGALVGPLLATWIVGRTSWTVVWLVIGLAFVPVLAGFLIAYPRPGPDGPAPEPAEQASGSGGLLATAVRQRAVVLGAGLLAVYVGLELSMGGWGFSYLIQDRGMGRLLAGYAVSGYWLGLTLGRFLISPAAARMNATAVGMMYACMTGVVAATALTWLLPTAAAAAAGFVLLGFFLGPIFPTTMALAPQLTTAALVPTAIGVMNVGSVVGGSALPWLAGTLSQAAGMRVLLPFAVVLGVLQLGLLRSMAQPIGTSRLRALEEPTNP
jgi:fucose permease